MATYNKIDLNPPVHLDEFTAGGVVRPGDILERDGAADVIVCGAGKNSPLFALHDRLQGRTIDDNYAATEQVMVGTFAPGSLVLAWLLDEQNVVAGQPLTANGTTGSLRAAVVGTDAVVAYAEEDLNLVGASGDARIVVRIA